MTPPVLLSRLRAMLQANDVRWATSDSPLTLCGKLDDNGLWLSFAHKYGMVYNRSAGLLWDPADPINVVDSEEER